MKAVTQQDLLETLNVQIRRVTNFPHLYFIVYYSIEFLNNSFIQVHRRVFEVLIL